jgi:hypothetical protein
MKITVRRVMGEITFAALEEAETICASLRDAGFESKISNGVDAMIWHDYDSEMASDSIRNEFDFTANVIIDRCPNSIEYITVVDPNHVPAGFGDYGEQPVVSSWWDAGGGSSVGLPTNTPHKGKNENDDQR